MLIDQIRDEFAKLESAIADGPIVPNVTAEEIRAYLGSRFDFKQAMPLDEVVADVEQMLRKWQVQVTHPALLRPLQSKRDAGLGGGGHAGGDVQLAAGQLAHLARGE
jgi:hypothetical protein